MVWRLIEEVVGLDASVGMETHCQSTKQKCSGEGEMQQA
jgi:hypothetical protein